MLVRWRDGDYAAVDQLIPLVYEELRRLARSHLRRQAPDQSLESAALVHEAYLRLTGKTPPQWQNRAHFFGIAADLMREILVDRVRRMRAAKRGSGARDLSLDEAIGFPHQKNVDMVRLDDALQQLAKLDERQCRIVELRFFAGLSLKRHRSRWGSPRPLSPVSARRLVSGFAMKWPGLPLHDARTLATGEGNPARRDVEIAGRSFHVPWAGLPNRSCASIGG